MTTQREEKANIHSLKKILKKKDRQLIKRVFNILIVIVLRTFISFPLSLSFLFLQYITIIKRLYTLFII